MKLILHHGFVFNLILSFSLYGITIQQVSIPTFMQKYPLTDWIQCTQEYPFNFTPFPLYPELIDNYVPRGCFKPVSILQIPDGTVSFCRHDRSGLSYVFFNDCFIVETQIKYLNWFEGEVFEVADISQNVPYIDGRLAILWHHFPECYGHWVFDVLGQLAMLEMHNVEYDYLCVPYCSKFMKESLELWGIDASKIIPLTAQTGIHAQTIIMVTSVTQTYAWEGSKSNYNMDFVLQFIRDKLLSGVESINKTDNNFSKKIFISRKGAPCRAVPNEDEIFALFETRGFKRYELTELSMAEQIMLFHQAQTIVSFVGSGSTNLIFCQPGTEYVEIVQSMVDATFFYMADIFKLRCSHINDSTLHDFLSGGQYTTSVRMLSVELVENFLREHPEL